MELKGIIPPLTTPFTKEGKVYEKGLRQLVEFQIEKGVHSLFICGTYGSGPVMTSEERKEVHNIVMDQAKGRIPIVVHVGTASTEQSVDLAQHAQSVGAQFVSSISPFYYHHDERTVVEYFRTLAASIDIPVYIYNNPKMSAVSVTGGMLRKLVDVGVKGIKDSNFGYIEFVSLMLSLEDKPDFTFIVGTEGIALPAFMSGAKGCVCGLGNAFPEMMVQLWDLFEAKKYEEAAALQTKVNKARQILHIPNSTNAACYAALHARGIDAGYPKAPVLPVEKDKEEAMIAAFKKIELL